jgi:CheY-like chemotaxis protein
MRMCFWCVWPCRGHVDHVLHVARDGDEAMAFLDAASAPGAPLLDLVLVDLHLPKYNGDEILLRLRSMACYAQTPVVVMTSSDAPADRACAQAHAALCYFRKPAQLEEFLQLGTVVREILAGSGDAAGTVNLA